MNKETKERTTAQREKIIVLMKNAKENGITNSLLKDISFNYTSRIAELRKEGYKFEVTDLGNGLYKYVLTCEPVEKRKQEKAIDIFWSMINNTEGNSISKDKLKDILKNNNFNVVRNWGCNL
jgi:hypothetical protein